MGHRYTIKGMKREVPFSIGFAVISIAAFFAFQFILSYPAVRESNAYHKAQLAAAAQFITPLAIPSSSAIAAMPVPATTITVTPGLLPVVALTPGKLLKQRTATAPKLALKMLAPTVSPQPASTAPQTALSAQAFLAGTTLAPRPYGGVYKAVFSTNAGAGAALSWGLDAATLGGTALAPQFSVSYSCDPPPNMPLPGDANQIPTFNVRSSYTCTVSLTPLSGNDRRIQSRSFSFSTGAGPFTVTTPAALATVLRNGENDGGFVFNNQDTLPVTVTGLTLDVSYTALNTGAGPMVLQILDPVAGTPIAEQHLEDIPADPTAAYTHARSGIVIPLSFTIKPMTQKLLPLRIMGVSVMGIPDATPTINVVLKNVAADQASGAALANNIALSWSCIVPPTGYDPNATSGPYATGQACR